ncbi:paramyosin-like isoform X2 [Tachysurus fulvidraco]|uniref:paramyosin-like isoform X2 n=1 Tax=Tachysurus fulvidraco TaxID=1234273 RepID=UPI000F4F0F02|nr:paramyosin-like isoform X2 [Tachysurus fulvidraco]
MDKFLSVFRAYSPERPLRPLLLATGAAAAAAGIYYLVKWTYGNKTTANPEDTSDPGDPVCNGATEPALVRLTEVVQDQMKCEREQEAHNLLKVQYSEMMETNSETVLKDSLAEADKEHQKAEEKHQKAEEKHQKAVETITQLEQEKINLTDQLKTLRYTMQYMGNQLCDIQLQCDELKKECEREQEAHNLLKVQYSEMMETNSETVLKTSLAEAEEKHQKAVETITQLEQEKSNLTDQVKSLRDTMKDMWKQLCDTQLKCDELKKECEQEQESHELMKSKYQEMMETLSHNEKLLKVLLAEAEEKHQKAVETITQLEQEKSNLTDQVKSVKDTVWDMWKHLCDTQLQCDELKKECVQEQEAHRLLEVKYQEMMETLTDSELLKTSLAEAEEKHQKAVETITHLEQEKSNLTDQVKSLRDTMKDMWNQLCDTQLKCDKIKNECEREQEAHNLLKVQYSEMMETNSETVLKASMAEAEEKHQKAVETITQLEQEKSNLTDQVKSLTDIVWDMWKHFSDTQLQCDKIKNECEREQEAHNLLRLYYHEMMETLTNSETVLKTSLAEAEEKHQKAVETITQLEQEKSNLTAEVKSPRDTMKDMWNHLFDIQLQCDKIKNECEQEQESHEPMRSEYQEMMETLTDSELLKEHDQQLKGHPSLKMEKDELKQSLTLSQHLLKESLNQAEERHQNAVQSTDELEAEMSGLKTHVDPVRLTRRDKIKRKFLKIIKCKSDKCLGTKDTESSVSQSGSSSESVCGQGVGAVKK